MTQETPQYPYGPGGTFWYVNGDGTISRCHHNNTGWRTAFLDPAHDKLTPERVCRLMREAYESGMEDGKEQIRRAIGVS